MITTTFTTLPSPIPSRALPSQFNARAVAWAEALPTLLTELTSWAGQANSLEDVVQGLAVMAQSARLEAQAAAAQVQADGDVEVYAAGTAYAPPAIVIGSDGAAYRRVGAEATGDNPVTSVTGGWVRLTPDPLIAAALLLGGGIVPGWDMRVMDPDAVYPPINTTTPAAMRWQRGTAIYRAVYTWDTSQAIARVSRAYCTYSADAGSTWTPVSATPYLDLTYSGIALIAAAWSPT
jgi:hypothetical protein